MLGLRDQFIPLLKQYGIEAVCPDVVQTLSVEELCEIVPTVDGWIIGDDPATEKVFQAGVQGNLKAAVKWGIGVDNVDFDACKRLSIPICNTPGMFGGEVADVALGYVIALARETFAIDRGIRNGHWPKNTGVSLAGKTVGVVGYGDIGSCLVKRLIACDMNVVVWDPAVSQIDKQSTTLAQWPNTIEQCDFIVLTCSLNKHNFHMLNDRILGLCKEGVRVINVARGPLIDEVALTSSLRSNKVHSAALDVFEVEPLPMDSFIREHPLCVLGSHNGSNSVDAVEQTNIVAIEKIAGFLGVAKQ
jgi:D-3-phosphoglycerate dehydrogenase